MDDEVTDRERHTIRNIIASAEMESGPMRSKAQDRVRLIVTGNLEPGTADAAALRELCDDPGL